MNEGERRPWTKYGSMELLERSIHVRYTVSIGVQLCMVDTDIKTDLERERERERRHSLSRRLSCQSLLVIYILLYMGS